MDHKISASWLAKLNCARSQLPHDFWSSYGNLFHSQIKDRHAK